MQTVMARLSLKIFSNRRNICRNIFAWLNRSYEDVCFLVCCLLICFYLGRQGWRTSLAGKVESLRLLPFLTTGPKRSQDEARNVTCLPRGCHFLHNAKFLQKVEKFVGACVTLLVLESDLCVNTFCLLVLKIIKIVKRNEEIFVYHVRGN